MIEAICTDNNGVAELTEGKSYSVLGKIHHKDGSMSVIIKNDLNLVDAYHISRFGIMAKK